MGPTGVDPFSKIFYPVLGLIVLSLLGAAISSPDEILVYEELADTLAAKDGENDDTLNVLMITLRFYG